MERKGGSTAVVTKEQVTTGLKTAALTAREEQALRMRYGAAFDKKAALPQAHGGNEALADELLLIEMRLLKALKAHRAPAAKTTAAKGGVKAKIASRLGKK
jgi:DNA-directed RNA polymerase sigma subunit (sigma70/sigma32)